MNSRLFHRAFFNFRLISLQANVAVLPDYVLNTIGWFPGNQNPRNGVIVLENAAYLLFHGVKRGGIT
jgi:hypothetical protein